MAKRDNRKKPSRQHFPSKDKKARGRKKEKGTENL